MRFKGPHLLQSVPVYALFILNVIAAILSAALNYNKIFIVTFTLTGLYFVQAGLSESWKAMKGLHAIKQRGLMQRVLMAYQIVITIAIVFMGYLFVSIFVKFILN